MSERRLLFLDALRGFFILYVIWLHALNGVVFGNNPEALERAPVWLLILFAPLALLGTWAPLFAVISGAAHAYVLHNITAKHQRTHGSGLPVRAFMAGAVATSIFLYLLSLFNMAFMHHSMPFNGEFRHTLFTSSLQQGRWLPFDADLLFYNDALSMVAVNGLLMHCLLFFLWRGRGFTRVRRYTGVLVGGAAGIFLLSPLVHSLVTPWFFEALNGNHYGAAFMLKLIVGPNLSPIPYLAYGMVGAVLGIGLARRVPVELFRRYGYGTAVALVVCGAMLFFSQGFAPVELIQHPFPLKMHCINLGLMLACCVWLIGHMEYCTEDKRQTIARRTLWLRRVGIMALTLFCLESFGAILLSKGYLWFFGIEGAFPRNPLHIASFLALVLIVWNVVLAFWERVNFKYSVEWWVSRLACAVRARPSVRLQAAEVLHKPCITMPVMPAVAPVVNE